MMLIYQTKDLKKILLPYQFRREIFKGDLEEIRDKIKTYQKKVDEEITEIVPGIKQCDATECTYCNICFVLLAIANLFQYLRR